MYDSMYKCVNVICRDITGKWLTNLYWLGQCHEKLGDRTEARRCYDKVLASEILREGNVALDEEDRDSLVKTKEAMVGL